MSAKFLKYLDFFPQTFQLTYKGKKVIRTKWGGFFSVVSLLIILSQTYLIGQDIFLRRQPAVLNFIETDKFAPTRRINYNRNVFMYQLTDLDHNHFYDDTIMQIRPFIHLARRNKKGVFKYREYELNIVDCIEEMSNRTQQQFEEKNIPHITKGKKCIKNFDSYLAGDWNDEFIMYLKEENVE